MLEDDTAASTMEIQKERMCLWCQASKDRVHTVLFHACCMEMMYGA